MPKAFETQNVKYFDKVEVKYVDYPSIDQINSFIFFGIVTTIVKPKQRTFSFSDLCDEQFAIDAVTKEDIVKLLEEESFLFQEGEGGVIELHFDEETILSLNTYNELVEYQWK